MPITILSPYSGKPVKVRDQDVGRAIRDEEGRIFYIVDTADGQGQYASMTRKGSDKDEERYRKIVDGSAKLEQTANANVSQVHDATGKKRSNPVGILLLIVVLLALAAAGYLYFARPDLLPWHDNTPATPDPTRQDAPQTPDDTPGNDAPDTNATPNDNVSWIDDAALATDGLPATLEPGAMETVPVLMPVMCWDWVPDDFPPALVYREGEGSDREPVALPMWEPASAERASAETDAVPADPLAGFRVLASGLRYKPIEPGEGQRAQAGHYVTVRYAAYAMDGMALIDDAQQSFILAAGQAIRAFDEGLAGVRPGGQRLLFVPRGHSITGRLPGIDELPEGPYLLDVQLESVRSGVTIITEAAGEGDPAMPGDRLTLDYTASVEGQPEPFDSSRLRGRALSITLGDGAVIPGLEFGLAGIRPGETRLLTIPPYLAYGERGAIGGLIPPEAVLTYRVTARSIQPSE
ncbi:MAG: FKBP-type peptidyl-prolyl cis-trans isomerase [Phycisphaerales bacterium JB063]